MIAERLPELAAMSREEKLEVLDELQDELSGIDMTEVEPYKSQIAALLEARLEHCQRHPETVAPWEEVRARLQQRYAEWKAARVAS